MDDFSQRKKMHLDFPYRDGYVYFVTICCSGSRKYFTNNRISSLVKSDLLKRQNELKQVVIYCYCIMPDHVHILLELDGFCGTLQDWIGNFKSFSTKEIKRQFGLSKIWQKNFYDHVVRGYESLYAITQYILYNPVRAGLVDDWRDWPNSYLNF